MKAYGHSRKDKLECKFGCCTFKSGKARSCRKVVDRANSKTARQEGKKMAISLEKTNEARFKSSIMMSSILSGATI